MRSSSLVDSAPAHDGPLAASSAHPPAPHGSYGTFVAYCFTVNYVLGVGILGIPWGFVRAGVALSPLVLLVVSLIRCVCVWADPDGQCTKFISIPPATQSRFEVAVPATCCCFMWNIVFLTALIKPLYC
jgi:hypothetical protein